MAKNAKTCRIMNDNWATNTKKFYSLIVQAEEPNPPSLPNPGSKVTHYTISAHHVLPRPMSSVKNEEEGFDKDCSLIIESWEPLECEKGTNFPRAFVKVQLLTGRTHQIRAQFAHLGWHLQDDIMYSKMYDRDECTRKGIEVFDAPLSLRCYRIAFKYLEQDYDIVLSTGPQE